MRYDELSQKRPDVYDFIQKLIGPNWLENELIRLKAFDPDIYEAIKDASWDRKYAAVIWMITSKRG